MTHFIETTHKILFKEELDWDYKGNINFLVASL